MAYIDTKYLGKCETCRHHSNSGCNTYCDHGEEYSPDLSKIPTADVVEVRHGEWKINSDGYYPYCSECGYEPKELTEHCPGCGALMDNKNKE